MRTIYITAGHSIGKGLDNGVTSAYGNEAEEARKFVTDLAKYLWKKYKIMTYTDNDKWSLRETIAWLGKQVSPPKYTIDIHFNAFNGRVSGTESYVPDNYNIKEFSFASSISHIISDTLGIIMRGYKGVKKESESQHPRLGILSDHRLSSANNVLVELCFIDNSSDMEKFKDYRTELIKNLAAKINGTI